MLTKFTRYYTFDTKGNVYSKYSSGRYPKLLNEPKLRKHQLDPDGYIRFTLLDNDKIQCTVFQHTLVLLMNNVLPIDSTYNQINHINGVKTDNSIANLEWCTGSENQQHRYTVLDHKSTQRKFTDAEVQKIRSEYTPFTKGKGITSLSKKYNTAYSVMRDIVQKTTYKTVPDAI